MRPTLTRAAVLGCALLATMTFLVTGCGKDSTVQPTITLAQAEDRVERILREAGAQLPAGAELKKHGVWGPIPCEGAGGVDSGQVFTERQYEIVHPDTWPTDQLIEILDQYWKSRGYRVSRDDRTAKNPLSLYVRDPADKTMVGIKLYDRGAGRVDAYLVSDSTCVWEFGTPTPRS